MMIKVEIPSEPIQMAQETDKINSYRQRAGQALQLVQEVVVAYKALELGDLTQAELNRLLKQRPQQLIREKVAGTEPVRIGTLTFSTEKVQELIELPDLRTLEKALSEVQEFQQREARTPYGLKALDSVMIVEGVVVANAEKLNQVEAMYTTYAVTEAEKEAYLYMKEAADILDYLSSKYSTNFVGDVLRQVTDYQAGGYTTNINIHLLKSKVTSRRVG
ncbi:hypothetical protein [Pontibacter arcticus]|uniref:Uncharacterized protein n=1 Tax=Pontibacter arcticus TaxID=2080288 RepID=A0A364RCH0_9BACT|nr:hypothetical protein [Pontibacter arcticus]RAU81969.1 hypothetical protein DP923_14920 [Pontibacter arcticus]